MVVLVVPPTDGVLVEESEAARRGRTDVSGMGVSVVRAAREIRLGPEGRRDNGRDMAVDDGGEVELVVRNSDDGRIRCANG